MNFSTTLIKTSPFFIKTTHLSPISKRVSEYRPFGVRFPLTITKCSRADAPLAPQGTQTSSSPSPVFSSKIHNLLAVEENIEKIIYGCRFLAILGVFGSLIGSFLCFVKGCTYVVSSFMEYFVNHGKVIILLVEAIDVYLLGTVMLVFGMGLYELFVSNLDIAKSLSGQSVPHRSSLFGLFTLKERPKWLEVKTVNELKTKLGHVIVMLLLIGFFEKINSKPSQPAAFLFFSSSSSSTMEKHQYGFLLIIFFVVSLGLMSFISCIIAESQKAKEEDMKLDNKLCYLPESKAFSFGIAALICLVIAQIIGNFVICSNFWLRKDEDSSKAKKPKIATAFLVLSW
ncbi:hypothetical protein GH714_017530 [Hevea brasiliensis]|uniref:Uncharacterized protein n=1 Tax=Hevea brasiliensis TaxID=3981 RepID=A0A6A6M9Y7_HEVBR|nr:hypothetical protein GH714_017530 [Hevea brasiliensis]